MWKEIFHFRFYKCSTPLRNIATSIENWTMYSKWGSNEIGQKCIHQNINLNLHIRPWNALLGHWPYNTIFLGQKCTLFVLRFLFIKKKNFIILSNIPYILQEIYFKKTQKKKQEFEQEFKKKTLTNVLYIISWYNVYLFIMRHFLFTLNSLITKWKKKTTQKKVHLGLPYNDMN